MIRRIVILLTLCVWAVGTRGADGPVDFKTQIEPILAEQCYACHGAEKQKGGLRLDVKAAALAGGTSGKSIEAGHGKESLFTQRLLGLGGEERMPLKKPALPPEQIELFVKWIDQGATWPEDGRVAEAKRHWSLIAPVRPAEPAVKDAGWVRNPIDRFVLARVEAAGLAPSPEAAKATLVRRLYLDLIGLPPSPAEVDAFVADASPTAYERVVDRLLGNPHFGERQARFWLDAARYADSNGYSIDAPRTIWPWRDWVINAFNADMPFDQFTVEQLAGDLLPNATLDQRIATGFHRNTPINEEGGIDKEQFRVDSVFDRVATTGTVWLGLTVGCAQCHNHKFDPISQKDYYRLFAFFNNCDEPKIAVPKNDDPGHVAEVKERLAEAEREFKAAGERLRPKLARWEASLTAEQVKKLPKAAQAALKVPAEKRTAKQQEAILAAAQKTEPDSQRWQTEVTNLKAELDGVTTMVVQERATEPRKSFVLIKGDFTRPGDEVTPGTLGCLPALKAEQPTRLDLARWIVSPENPLTARVQVNRIWARLFGRGIVETDNDFGTQGTPPTDPELLDYLATEFVARKWSTKAMLRQIVMSATYRQASNVTPALKEKDPYNKLFARQSRFRLEAEVVRDVALAGSGLLAEKVGGPSVFPPQPEGILSMGQVKRVWKTSTGEDRYRRGLYTFIWRQTPHPELTAFDLPDATLACTRRNRSNTPLQALTLLNDEAFVEYARALAGRALKEGGASDEGRLKLAFRLCTTRDPSADEMGILRVLLDAQRAELAAAPHDARALVGERAAGEVDPAEFGAWVTVSRALLNLDETISRE